MARHTRFTAVGIAFLLVASTLGALAAPAAASAGTVQGDALAQTANNTTTTTATATTETAETTTTTDGKFRVGPDVRLRPVEDDITNRQPGLMEMFISNPAVNGKTVTVSATISVPAGVHMTGESLATGAGAGTVTATYEVPPGTSRTIAMRMFPTETGEFTTDARVLYWPGDNRDAFNQFSLTHSFNVESIPEEPDDVVESDGSGQETTKGPVVGTVPTSAILLVVGVGLVLAVIIYAWKSGAEVVVE
jgi:hypothetical protein